MAEDWTGIAAEVAAALADVGFTATMTRSGGRDPASPEWDPVMLPDSTHPLTVMQDTLGLSQIDGTLIRAGDLRLMCAAEGGRSRPRSGGLSPDRCRGRDHGAGCGSARTALA